MTDDDRTNSPNSPLYANAGGTPLLAFDPASAYPGEDGGRAAGRPRSRVWQLELTPRKAKRKDLMHFSRQMAVFIRGGIPILEAIESITEEMSSTFLRNVLLDTADGLRAGETFSGALSRHADAFPPYYLGILRSAEMTGRLDDALERLGDYVERDLETRRKIVGALTYPAIIALMAVAVVIVLVTFVLPRFENFFRDLGATLPLATRLLISVSHWFSSYWAFLACGLLAVLLPVLTAAQTRRGRHVVDALLLRLPLLGDLIRHAEIERFCRILSSMTSAGVPLPEALGVTSIASGNTVYRDGIDRARAAMIRGEGLAAPLAATGLFPTAARQMLRVGENTGTLDDQLQTAATFYERELEFKIKRFTTLFEPAVIVLMGLVVGFVAIALVSAMYGIFRQVHP